MSPRHPSRRPTAIAYAAATAVAATATLLTACGGGGGSTTDVVPEVSIAPVIPPVSITGTVADGPLSGAIVCYDLNNNSRCENSEPRSAPTDANGRFSLTVSSLDAGKHAVIAEVPATAIDKDTGAEVGTAITLMSPATGQAADHAVFVSPLTSLVQAQIDATGSSLAGATAFVQAQAGLTVSPLVDFTAPAPANEGAVQQAATVARLTMLTWVAQTEAVSGVVGAADLSGSITSAFDVRGIVARAVLGQLPAVAIGAADASITKAADAAAKTQALRAVAADIVANQGGLTPATALASIGAAKLPVDSASEAPSAGGSLPILRFTDTDNWFYRAFLSTAEDSAPDAQGGTRYYDLRSQKAAGVTTRWGFGNSADREGDLHWNGSAWVACPLGSRSKTSARDSQGRASGDYCDGFELNVSTRSSLDISGKTLRSVAETIRATPGSYNGVAYAAWGPRDLAQLGEASFPAGSQLRYQTSLPTRTAYAYDARPTTALTALTPEVAAGGDARTGSTAACGQVTSATTASFQSPVSSLDDLVARNPGLPCRFNPGTGNGGSSGPQNDWWGNSTVSIGTIANAATVPEGTGSYYSTTAALRAGFVPGTSSVNYYSCLLRASDSSARNCTLLSSGSYSVETVGDARVLRFTGLPAMALRLGFNRLYVERGGKVYSGYQNPVGISSASVRLNLTAANAVFTQLGMPTLTP